MAIARLISVESQPATASLQLKRTFRASKEMGEGGRPAGGWAEVGREATDRPECL